MNNKQDFYTTKTFSCPTTDKPVIGVYFPALKELKFRIDYDTQEDDLDTMKWCMSASKRSGNIKSINQHIKSLGLDNSEIFIEE